METRFPHECIEVTIGNHRADVMVGNQIVEFQHSSISVADIVEREHFYGPHLSWVFDARAFKDNVYFRDRGSYQTFRWLWPRKTHGVITRPLFWDMGDGTLFNVGKLHLGGRAAGWGRFVDTDALVSSLCNDGRRGST